MVWGEIKKGFAELQVKMPFSCPAVQLPWLPMQSITQVWCMRPFCYCSGFTFASRGVIVRLPQNVCQLTPPFYSFMSVFLFLFCKGSHLVHRLVQVQALGVIANEHCMLPWVLIMEEKMCSFNGTLTYSWNIEFCNGTNSQQLKTLWVYITCPESAEKGSYSSCTRR